MKPATSVDNGGTAPREIMAGLLRFIRERRLEPGERLPSERDLAGRFDVSRSTIREVLNTLECFRLVERRPGSGVYLREEATDPSLETLVLTSDLGIELDREEVLQSMETRRLLEIQAVRLCCKRRSEADLQRMRSILLKTAEFVRAGTNVADLDAAFHLAIVAGTQNTVLVRVVKPFYLLSGRRRTVYFAGRGSARRSLADHRKLLAAIEAKNEAAAARIIAEHIGGVEDYWQDALTILNAPK